MKKLVLFLIITSSLQSFGAQYRLDSINSEILKIKKLRESVYLHTSFLEFNNNKVPCNGLFWVKNNEAIIFDSPADSLSAALLIEHLLKNEIRIKAVIAHHFHEDCTGGLMAFHAQGVESFASQHTINLCLSDRLLPAPKNALNQNQPLTLGNDTVLTHFFGEAHTKDNMISYIPSEKTLFGGCALKELNGSRGYLGDANVNTWSTTVSKIKIAYPEIELAIPGHGEPGGMELLDFTINMFSGTQGTAKR